jgi:WD40 repeat protein
MNPLSPIENSKNFYVVGGTLRHDAPSYIERQADHELFEGIFRGELCYVLTARQMGKSSLMIRTAQRLRTNGIVVAVLDLTAIGQNLTIDQWYCGLLLQIGQRLDLEDELLDFWQAHSQLGAMQRWLLSLRSVVLPQNLSPLVIFIDEIDAVRSLPFQTDEFFSGIRECHNLRSEDPIFERLTFCLMGVATPADLIRDTRTTPFNIGRRIELDDFTNAEALPLARGMGREYELGAILLQRVLYWTNGHPFLTQRLCEAVAQNAEANSITHVDQLCQELFLLPSARERDDNLLFVREQILRSEADLTSLLDLYRKVRKHKKVADERANPLAGILRLSGITRSESGQLTVRNRIYEHVFNPSWIDSNIPDAELRRQRAAYRKGIFRTAMLSTIILALMGWLAFVAVQQRNRAQQEIRDNQRLIYWSNFNLAQQEVEKHQNISRANELLQACIPTSGQEDLRNFEWYYLWNLTHQEEWGMKEKNEIISAMISSEAKTLTLVELVRLANGKNEHLIKILDLATRNVTKTFHTPAGNNFNWGVFSPDQRQIATDSSDYLVSLWNLETGLQTAVFKGHTQPLTAISFSPDGKWLATGDLLPMVKIWEVATGQEKYSFRLSNNTKATEIVFSPDSRRFMILDGSSKMRTWNVLDGSELPPFRAEGYSIEKAVFFPDGIRLLTSSKDRKLIIWDYETRKKLFVLPGHQSYISAIEFSPNGQWIATGSTDRTVKIWSSKNGQERQTITGHGSEVSTLVWMPDSHHLLTGSPDMTLKSWDLQKPAKGNVAPDELKASWATTFSANGDLIALCDYENEVKIFNMDTRQTLANLPVDPDKLLCAKFSPDNKFVATGESNAQVKIWEASTGRQVITLHGHQGSIYSVRFSPDGQLLVTGGSSHQIRIFEINTGQEIANLKGDGETSYCAEFSPDGQTLAFASQDGNVNLWDIQKNKLRVKLSGHQDLVIGMGFSHDNHWLATAGMDRTLRLWNLATGQQARIFGQNDLSQRVTFSPNNKRFVSGGRDGMVKLWDIQSGQEVLTLAGHTAEVRSVTFSPDGTKLATGGDDNIVSLWEAPQIKSNE